MKMENQSCLAQQITEKIALEVDAKIRLWNIIQYFKKADLKLDNIDTIVYSTMSPLRLSCLYNTSTE